MHSSIPSLFLTIPGSYCDNTGTSTGTSSGTCTSSSGGMGAGTVVSIEYACVCLSPPVHGGVRAIEGQLELLMMPTRESDR
jgi:hypothetical protein